MISLHEGHLHVPVKLACHPICCLVPNAVCEIAQAACQRTPLGCSLVHGGSEGWRLKLG